MAKWYGLIGFGETVETSPGVWGESIKTRSYFGDVIRNIHRTQSSENLNDNLNVSNKISIVSDPYANKNFSLMKFLEFMGAKWKITEVEVQYPRLILTIGGVYTGNE